MYTRDYKEQDEQTAIPKNYGGTAFTKSENEEAPTLAEEPKIVENKEFVPSWVEKMQLNSFFPKIGELFSGRLKLGTEEIIILGIIAFLLFSKSKDFESIIILVALLLI